MILIDPISPVAFSLFGFDVRWYALAYVAAFFIGGAVVKYFSNRDKQNPILTKKQFDDLFTAVVLGTIIGGRLGYVLFYNPSYFMQNPMEIFAIWKGGMSFHGGLLGVFLSVCRLSFKMDGSRGNFWGWFKNTFKIMDIMSVAAPIGLFFGRIANFINMEVMGRVTTKPWGVVFNGGDPLPRHPSPLYEAAMEGIVLFILSFCLYKFTKLSKRAGVISGIFTMSYAMVRMFCEQFRQPDAQIGFLTSWGLTMGQLLSALMFMAGAAILIMALKNKK